MTLEDIQKKLQDYLQPLKQKFLLILLSGIIGGGLFFLNTLSKDTLYIATATFHPEKTSKQTLSLDPVAYLLGGGGGGMQGSGNEEMRGVLASRKLSEIVAADTFLHQGEERLLADIALEAYLSQFSLRKLVGLGGEKLEDFSYEDKIIFAGEILRSRLSVDVNDYGFMVMRLTAKDPVLVREVAETYIDELIDYYQDQQTEKARYDYGFFDQRADTVRMRLENAINFIASYYDTRKYRTQAQAEVVITKKEAEVEYLKQVLQQLLVSREQALSQLQRDRPVIQVLDPPLPPFNTIQPRRGMAFLSGMMLGLLLSGLFFTRRLLIRDLTDLINEALASDEDAEAAG